MIDIVGAIVLAALAVTTAGTLVLSSALERRARGRLLAVAGLWLVAVTALGAADVFTTLGTPAIAVAVVAPLVLALASAARGSALRTLALAAPLPVLVLANSGRLLGAFFLVLHAQGRLPATFALPAGWGDIAVALLAIPVAWLAGRGASGRPVALAWNAVGFVDLLAAVTLGIGSAPQSPLQFLHEGAAAAWTMGLLPWVLIPGFLVPLYLLTHLAVFARLLRAIEPAPAQAPVVHGGR